MDISIHILETSEEFANVEELQRRLSPGNEADIVPIHLLIAAVQAGGLVLGAYVGRPPLENQVLAGFVFSFPGLYHSPGGLRPMHCSHAFGVHPGYRRNELGFLLKRAQWQMVRHQGIDRIVWTCDPLDSQEAELAFSRLGAVCSSYLRDYFGPAKHTQPYGLPTDCFQVDWWLNSQRVYRRLSRRARRVLDLAHYFDAGAKIINPSLVGRSRLPHPNSTSVQDLINSVTAHPSLTLPDKLLLVEIPASLAELAAADLALAIAWRQHTRTLFETLFTRGYMVTDFIHLSGRDSRCFYVLSHAESTL